MEDIEKIIEELENQAHYFEDECADQKRANVCCSAIQTIRELQRQIPKWHYVVDGDLPEDSIKDVSVCLKNGGVLQASWFIFDHTFKMICEHGIHEFYADNPVIAWMELPKFESEG